MKGNWQSSFRLTLIYLVGTKDFLSISTCKVKVSDGTPSKPSYKKLCRREEAKFTMYVINMLKLLKLKQVPTYYN